MPRIPFAAPAILSFLVVAAISVAEPLVKPLPVPDYSRLPQAQAGQLRKDRAEFDRQVTQLVGDRLVESFALIGIDYAAAGLFDVARVAFENAAALQPNDGRWVYLEAANAQARKDNAVATTLYQRAVSLLPDYLPARLSLARLYLAANDVAAARKLLDDWLARHQDQAAPYALRAQVALTAKDYRTALADVDAALKLQPQATSLYELRAKAAEGAGDTAAAQAARARIGKGVVAFFDPIAQGQFDLAGTSAAPDGPAGKVPATPADPFVADLEAATRSVAVADFAKARASLDDALRRKPNDPVALAMYARVDAAAGDLDQARARADAAIRVAPGNALANLSQGIVLEMSHDPAGAAAAYLRAISAQDSLTEPHQRLGDLYMREHRYADAAGQYLWLTRLAPDAGSAWAKYVAAEGRAGQCARAADAIHRVLAAKPDWGYLMQMSVRVASTCPASSAEQKKKALADGERLYRSVRSPAAGETYALALAANGRWPDAIATQAGAMFDLTASGRKAEVAVYREFYKDFSAKKMPADPWPASSPLYDPPPPAILLPPKPAKAATPKK